MSMGTEEKEAVEYEGCDNCKHKDEDDSFPNCTARIDSDFYCEGWEKAEEKMEEKNDMPSRLLSPKEVDERHEAQLKEKNEILAALQLRNQRLQAMVNGLLFLNDDLRAALESRAAGDCGGSCHKPGTDNSQ